MGKRDKLSQFDNLALASFTFLVDEMGFMGPEVSPHVISYFGPRFSVKLFTDPRTHDIYTTVGAMVGGRYESAGLDCLFVEARLGPAQRIRFSGRTRHQMEVSLASQASCLRRLLPILAGPQRDELLARCHGR